MLWDKDIEMCGRVYVMDGKYIREMIGWEPAGLTLKPRQKYCSTN